MRIFDPNLYERQMNIDPNEDSLWVTLPPSPKMTPRDFFTSRAAELYNLRPIIRIGGLLHARVEKQFHKVMQSYPLPPDPFKHKPTREELLPHLVACRLQGAPLPFPMSHFT